MLSLSGSCNFFAVNCAEELSNSTIFTLKYFLEIIVSIYRFKRHNFVSEYIIFESKTCLHNGHYFERTLGLFHIMRILHQTSRKALIFRKQKIVDDKKISPLGETGFNQVLIQVQLLQSLPFVTTMKKKIKTRRKRRRRKNRYSTEF